MALIIYIRFKYDLNVKYNQITMTVCFETESHVEEGCYVTLFLTLFRYKGSARRQIYGVGGKRETLSLHTSYVIHVHSV